MTEVSENKKKINWTKVAEIGAGILGAAFGGLAIFAGIKKLITKSKEPIQDPNDPEKVVTPALEVSDVLTLSVKSAGSTCSKLSTLMSATGTLIDTMNSMFGDNSNQRQGYYPNTNCYDPNGCFYAQTQGFPVYGGGNMTPVGNRYWDASAYQPGGFTYYPNGSYSCNSGNGQAYFTGNPLAR